MDFSNAVTVASGSRNYKKIWSNISGKDLHISFVNILWIQSTKYMFDQMSLRQRNRSGRLRDCWTLTWARWYSFKVFKFLPKAEKVERFALMQWPQSSWCTKLDRWLSLKSFFYFTVKLFVLKGKQHTLSLEISSVLSMVFINSLYLS